MFDVCGTFFQSEAARRGGGIGGAVAAACLAHGRPPRVGCAHVLPAASPARASASTAQSYPCLPPAFSCAPPPAFPMRPIPAPARVLRTALSLRAAGFVRPPREGRILAASQRVPYPPPAASPCARVRIHCAVLSLPAAGSVCRVALRAPVIACAPREGRILAASQRVPARRVALRAHPHPLRSPYPCLPPVFSCAPREGRILAASQRVPCPPPAASPCARVPHPLRSPIPACRRFCVPRRPAPARPRSPCGLTPPARISSAALPLRAARRRVLSVRVSCAPPPAFPVRPIPARRGFCPPPVLPALRGKGGYWQGASACRARRVALRAAARVIRTALSLRAAGFVRPPREGRILAGIQRPPASPVRPIPAPARVIRTALSPPCRGFCPSAAGRVDIGREPARAVPAASPCAPARVLRAA